MSKESELEETLRIICVVIGFAVMCLMPLFTSLVWLGTASTLGLKAQLAACVGIRASIAIGGVVVICKVVKPIRTVDAQYMEFLLTGIIMSFLGILGVIVFGLLDSNSRIVAWIVPEVLGACFGITMLALAGNEVERAQLAATAQVQKPVNNGHKESKPTDAQHERDDMLLAVVHSGKDPTLIVGEVQQIMQEHAKKGVRP
jgi:hypothetical protein